MSTEETEPKGSTSSSPDDLFAPGAEAYYRKVLKLDEPKDTLPRGGAEGVHVHEWGTWECIGLDRAEVWIRRCPCGASQSRSEKPEELEAERWKTGRCRDCEDPIPQGKDRCSACAWKASNAEPEYACTVLHKDRDGNTIPCPDEKPQEPVCQARWMKTGEQDARCSRDSGHDGTHQGGGLQWPERVAIYPLSSGPVCTHVSHLGPWFQQSDGKWRQVSICELCKVTLPGTHAVHDPCTHCQGPHALEDCKGLEEPEEGVCACGHPEEVHRAGLSQPYDGCNWCKLEQCGGYRTESDAETAPVPIPRRPPYAVAYAVEGGAQYEVAVSGDATVVAEDGALHILHPKKPVLAIVRVTPMNMEESDG